MRGNGIERGYAGYERERERGSDGRKGILRYSQRNHKERMERTTGD